jgi:ATP dependent DNA ligase C terminal region
MIDIGKLSFRGEFGIANGSAVTDFVLAGVAQEFDQSVMRKMLSISPNDLAAKLTEGGSVLVCTKVDGEGTFVYFDQSKTGHEQLFAFSVGGRVRVGFKALNELGNKLKSAGVQSALLRCELSLAAQATRQASLAQVESNTIRDGVSEVIRVSFSGTEAEIERFRLVVLDVVMLDRKDLRANQHDFNTTLQWMQKVIGCDKSRRSGDTADEAQTAYCMHAEVVAEKDLRASFDRLVQAGEEGIVVRRLNRNDIWKIKPHRTIDAVVIGYVEGEFEDKYGVNSMLTALCLEGDQQGVMQSFVRVGGGLSDELRVSLLDRLRALKVQEPIAMTDSSGRVIHFIRPELMIEIHGEDLISQEQGKAVRSQRLRWDAGKAQYEFLGLAPCPRLSFARFAKFREDKRWQDGGARISQVGKSSESTAQGSATTASAEPAKVIRREVYTKAEMLRKLVIVHQAAASFPYMIYWTDFSAKRAEPLKVTIEIAADEQRANQLAQRLVAENVVKGWEKFSP